MEELQEKDKLVYVYTSKPIEIMEKGWSYVRLDEEVASGFLDDIESIPKNLNPDKWQDTFLTIYNQVEGDEDSPAIMLPDSYRKNCVFEREEELSSLFVVQANLRRIAKAIHPRLRDVQYTWLKSVPGGVVQAPHIDFSEEYLKSTKFNLYSFILPVTRSGAKVRVFKNCRKYSDYSEVEDLYIPYGYVLVIRGDLVHAGHSYQEENYRLHCYVAEKRFKKDSERYTYTSAVPEIRCQWCGKEFYTRKALTDHCRSLPQPKCPNYRNKFPDYPKVKEVRWDNGKCTACEENCATREEWEFHKFTIHAPGAEMSTTLDNRYQRDKGKQISKIEEMVKDKRLADAERQDRTRDTYNGKWDTLLKREVAKVKKRQKPSTGN